MVFLRCLLQMFNVAFNVVRHVVEGFAEFADLGRAAYFHALVEFRAAHRARRRHEALNGLGDAEREKISEEESNERRAEHEAQRFARQIIYTRVNSRLFHAALCDHSPAQRRDRAIRPDHFDRSLPVLLRLDKSNCRRRTQFLRQFLEFLDDRRSLRNVESRNHFVRVCVRHDATVNIGHEEDTVVRARILQTRYNAIERHNRGEHPRKLPGRKKRHRHHESRPVIRLQSKWLAHKVHLLNARRECPLQRGVHERIFVGTNASSRFAASLPVHGSHVENI